MHLFAARSRVVLPGTRTKHLDRSEGIERMPKGKPKVKQRAFKLRPRAKRRLTWGVLGMILPVVGWYGYQAAGSLPGTSLPTLGNDHLPSLSTPHPPYNSDPPTSGPHLGSRADWGIHAEPIPKELQVHNLEDGGVLVQYNCPQSCPDLVERLTGIVSRYDKQVILAPYPGMDKRIALTAWGWLDKLDEFDEQRIVRFIKAYRGIDHHVRTFTSY